MSAHASRRAVLLGLAALPAAGVTTTAAAPADPHVAMVEEALALWRQHKATKFGWGFPGNTVEARRASDDHGALIDACMRVSNAPPPQTLAGLRALTLAVALANEGAWSMGEDGFERMTRRFIEAAITVTGTVLPEGFDGMIADYDEQEGDDA